MDPADRSNRGYHGLYGATELWFDSENCTGDAYLYHFDPARYWLAPAATVGPQVWVAVGPEAPPVTMIQRSWRSSYDGQCYTPSSPTERSAHPAQVLMYLDREFTPPFVFKFSRSGRP